MSYTKNIFYNTIAQYVGKGFGILASIVVTSILTRSLGVVNYGQYVYVYSLVLLLNALADWGTTFIATREAAKENSNQNTIYSTTILTRLFISLSFQVVLLLVGQKVPSLRNQFLPLVTASFLLPILSLKTSLQVVFQSRFQLWRLSLIDTISSLVFMAFVLLLSTQDNFSTNIFIYLSLSALLGTLVGVFLALPLFSFNPRVDVTFAKHLLTQSISMGALLTLYSVYNRLDVFILRYFQGDTAVGIYGFSYKVYENLVIIAAFLANATFPLLSSRSLDKPLFKQAFEKYFAALLTLGTVVSLSLYLAAPFIVRVLAGPDFAIATIPLRILSLAVIAAFLGHATGYSLVALNLQVAALKIVICSLLLNAVLNYLLIPHYSFQAAAFTTFITEIFAFFAGLFVISKKLGGINFLSGFKALSPKELIKSLQK